MCHLRLVLSRSARISRLQHYGENCTCFTRGEKDDVRGLWLSFGIFWLLRRCIFKKEQLIHTICGSSTPDANDMGSATHPRNVCIYLSQYCIGGAVESHL